MKFEDHIPVITVDGPSGTGKGTICLLLAQKLKWHFLDSGSIYRVLAYAVTQQHVDETDTTSLVQLAKDLPLRFVQNQDRQLIYLNDQEIGREIRQEWCGQYASKIAALPEVRGALLQRQRAFAMWPGLVTDGRDMGTIVFPQATLKFFLDATTEARAQRRYLQLKKTENNVSLAEVIDELVKRDARDIARTH